MKRIIETVPNEVWIKAAKIAKEQGQDAATRWGQIEAAKHEKAFLAAREAKERAEGKRSGLEKDRIGAALGVLFIFGGPLALLDLMMYFTATPYWFQMSLIWTGALTGLRVVGALITGDVA